MVDRGFKNDVILVILPFFDLLTVIDREDMEKGVEYIRSRVHNSKDVKQGDKKLNYFKKTLVDEKIDRYVQLQQWRELEERDVSGFFSFLSCSTNLVCTSQIFSQLQFYYQLTAINVLIISWRDSTGISIICLIRHAWDCLHSVRE